MTSRWVVHGRRTIYTSEWVELRLDDVELPGGRRVDHHVLRFPRDSAGTVVLDGAADGDGTRVLLLWRERFITGSTGWEIPAGWADDGEDPAAAAAREVEEETGWRPGPLTPLCGYDPQPGICDARFHLFTAAGATYQGPPSDPTEAERVEWVPLARLPELIAAGELRDGPTLTALAVARLLGR
jgi:8-oxo-dGTP pyrophosphatase MutT (NUDIX family)